MATRFLSSVWGRTLTGCSLLTLSAVLSADVAFLDITGDWRETGGDRRLVQTVNLSNACVEFALQYDISASPDTPDGRCFSVQWAYEVGMISLGMLRPSMANWYYQGCFDLQIDGVSLRDYAAEFTAVRPGGEDAMCTAAWQLDDRGTVKLHFLLRGGDDKLLVRPEWELDPVPETVELRLLNYPNWFKGVKDRWIATAERDVQHEATVQLNLPAEAWVFYQDRGEAPYAEAWGGSGLILCPEELTTAEVEVTSYPIWTRLRFKPERGRATIGLWDFTGIENNAVNLEYLKTIGPAAVADLRQAAAHEWDVPVPFTLQFPAERKRVYAGRGEFETTPFDRMTDTVTTPHREWAKPLDGGKLRVLFIAPRWNQRETVELAQRLDLDYETVSVAKSDELFNSRWLNLYGSFELYGYKPRTLAALLNDFNAKLDREYDCIVITAVQMDILPEFITEQLIRKIREGTGLVGVGRGRSVEEWVRAHSPEKADFSPVIPGASTGSAYKLGDGRVLMLKPALDWLPQPDLNIPAVMQSDFSGAGWEYSNALFAKAVLWAAGRDQAVTIETLTPKEVRLTAAAAVPGAELMVSLHDGQGRKDSETTRAIDVGTTTVPLGLTILRDGVQFLDVTIRRDGRVIDWASMRFEYEGPVAIEEARIENEILQRGEPVSGSVIVRADTPIPLQLSARIVDSWGRTVAEKTFPAAAGQAEVAFNLPLPHPLSVVHRLELVLRDDAGVRDREDVEFTVPDTSMDDFMFLMWYNAGNSPVHFGVTRELARHGVDTLDNVGLHSSSRDMMAAQCRNAAWTNLRSIPYITRIASMQRTGNVRKPCLTDPNHVQSWMDALRRRAAGSAAYGCPGYTLGDENFLVSAHLDVCYSPTCLAGFRDYLRGVYGSLDAVNAEWGTDAADWEALTPITFDEAKESGAWPRWADHRLYMERVLTKAHADGARAIRDSDPGARVGFDGVFSLDSWHGYDFYQLCRACDLNQVYCLRLNQVEYLRSFAQPDALLGAWHNRIGNDDEVSAKRVPWHLLFSGFNSSWYWMAYGTGPAALFPDLRPTPQMQWMAESHAEIKAGIGKLIMNSDRLHDRVAIHYSQASVHGNTLLDRNLVEAHFGAMFAVEDLGLQYNFVAYEQIEQGALADYNVLIMPASCALSEKEAVAIRSFVQKGGLVIADVYPAIMNGHCRILDKAALDDVFGATVTRAVNVTKKENVSPAFKAVPFGEGGAVLLGFPLGLYRGLRDAGEEGPVREALRRIFSDHGVTAPVQIVTENGPVGVCEVTRFRNGDIEFVGIVKEDNVADAEPVQATVKLPRKARLYDVRAGRYIGDMAEYTLQIVPGVPILLAMLPHEVHAVTLGVPRRAVHVGDAVPVRVGLTVAGDAPGGQHVVHIDVLGPDGAAVPHYAQNVLLTGSATTATIPFAFSDPPGQWHLRAKDVATGKTVEVPLRLQP